MRNIFEPQVASEIIERIERLTPHSQPLWGKMSVAQMLAHCNVTYEMVYEDIHPRPAAIKKFLLKRFVKTIVVNEAPYKRNSATAPEFLMTEEKDFETERSRLIKYIERTTELGAHYFDQKESHSFGPLTVQEWNNMFYKHLEHHLSQFGV